MTHLIRSAKVAVVAVAVAASLMGCKDKSGSASTQPGASGKTLVVGFAQVGAESGWRTANTKSVKDEAAKRGIDLKFSDAQQKQENQIAAIQSYIAQGVNVIMFSPVVSTGWTPVLKEAKAAGIPVIVSDRSVDSPEDLFASFIGSDFTEEGRRAGNWLVKKTDGKAVICQLEGTPGSAPANDRKKGFEEVIKTHPDMKVVFSQTGEFTRTKGKEVMETFLKTPDAKNLTAVFAHNDDMALGAIQAMQEAGLKPGKDIVVVSIDGVKDAFQAMVDGTLNCTVECNPLIGPQLFDAAEKLARGETIPRRIQSEEGVFDQSQAAAALPTRGY
ncbi:MAG: ABC transporter substrate-binding protein [Tepidisphaeraceae bacterium]